MRYEAILIDLDGVIRQWPGSDEPIETMYGLPVGSIRRTAFAPDLLDLAITGRITDEEWRRRTADKLLHEGGSPRAAEAVAHWSEQTGTLDRKVLALLEGRHASVRLILVTNATTRLARDLDAIGLAERFHGIVNSSDLGFKKPAEQVFRTALRQAGASAETALFIDDTSANITAAAALGITCHQYRAHAGLSTFLRQAAVLRSASG